MVKVVLFLATGFEEIEVMSIVDTLRRAGVEVVIAGLQEGATLGSRGVNVIPDRSIDAITLDEFAAVILPGGSPGYINLGRDSRVQEFVTQAFEEGRIVAAICGAPTVLAYLGILKGKKATVFPGKERDLTGAEFVNERVVVDGTVVTSKGPGTAIEFGITLVELLVGKQRAQEVKDDLVANF